MLVQMKPEQERVKTVLIDTVALLCKNGLSYERELKIQAVIGVTVDENDVFIVHINESFNPHGASSTSSSAAAAETSMAVVPFSPSGQQIKREFEATRTPSSAVKRMRAESMPAMSPTTDPARQHAKQQLRFPSPAKNPSPSFPGPASRVPGGMSTLRRGGVVTGRGPVRGLRRGAVGRGFPDGRSQRGPRMSGASGRPTSRGSMRARGRGLRLPSVSPSPKSDYIPTKHEMKFSPGNMATVAEASSMRPSHTAPESSVGFNFNPYHPPSMVATNAPHSGGGDGDLPAFSINEPDRFVNTVPPGFGFDGVFSPDSSGVQMGNFADINPSLEFGFPPSFPPPNAAGGFVRSGSSAQNVGTGNIKTESFNDDVIFVDDDATDSAAAAAGNGSSSTSASGAEVVFDGSSDLPEGADGVAGAAVQQITRKVTITTNIQGQNVKYEQVLHTWLCYHIMQTILNIVQAVLSRVKKHQAYVFSLGFLLGFSLGFLLGFSLGFLLLSDCESTETYPCCN